MTEKDGDIQHLTAAEKRELLIKLLQQKKAKESVGYSPSYGQRALWFIQQVYPSSSAYNESFAWRMKAQLSDEQGLDIARVLSERHSILRTTYQLVDGKPVATVHPSIPLDYAAIDARDWDDAQLRHAMQDHANRPIDLKKGPVIRLRLFRSKNELAWMTTIHHIAIDMSSMMILMEDIKTIFACKMASQPIPEWSHASYDQFAIWQKEFVQSEEGKKQQAFWVNQLKGIPPLKLPTDFPAKALQDAPGATANLRIPHKLTQQLERLAKEQNATLYALLLTAFQVLLGRYSRQEQFLLGSVVSGRTQAKFQKTIGLYANPIAIPTDQSDNPTFTQYLQRNRQFLLGVLANQDYPFSLLVEELSPQNDQGRSPLVNVAFILQTHQRSGLENFDPYAQDAANVKGLQRSMGGIGVEILPIHQQHAKFDLRLEMFQAGEELMGTMHYDSSLFEAESIEYLIDSFLALLDSILVEPNELISRLSVFGGKSQALLLDEKGEADSTPPIPFVENFRRQVELHPTSIAVESLSLNEIDRQWTYRQLSDEAERLVVEMERSDRAAGSTVAYYLPRSAEAVASMLACWTSGRISLSLDPTYPVARLRYMISDAKPKIILSVKKYADAIHSLLSEMETQSSEEITCVWIDEPTVEDEAIRPAPMATHLDSEQAAYLIYTSGSTGEPKGVVIPHRGLANVGYAMSRVMGVQPSDRIFQTASFSFDASIADIVQALGNGATLVLADPTQYMVGDELWEALSQSQATIATLSPSVLATVPRRPLPKLRVLLVAAEECGRDLVQHWSVGRAMFNAYGPSETSVCATMHRCYPNAKKPAIGKAIPNVQVYVMDRLMQPLPVGALGEICIGGESVGLGYIRKPELTKQAFVPDPFATDPGRKLYRTGDIGRWRSDGSLEFHGRRDQQVKIRGMRVELEEIEHVLLDSASVHQVAIAAGSEFQDQIVAFVVEKEPKGVDFVALQEKLRGRLPAYMLPRFLIRVDKIPTNANGKVDRTGLIHLWKHHLKAANSAERNEYVAPRNELEQQVAQIFSEVLQVERVGVNDDFFELGGHSLMAAELATKLRPLATAPVPLYLIMGNPTVSGVANAIAGNDLELAPSPDLDLAKEAILDSSIRPTSPFRESVGPKRILLTGATGFLGAHLLNELLRSTEATVHCLIRASSIEEGMNRIEAKFQKLGIEGLDRNRIQLELGDFSEPLLGLDEERFRRLGEEIDVIYHNGAMVNFSLPYRQLRPANVLGTETVIRLACQAKTKPLHYVSSLSVFPAISLEGDVTYLEEDPLADYQQLFDGYSQSKWVAEKLVHEAGKRGLPFTVYRPGRITGESRRGIGEAEDLLWSVLRQCLWIGAVPAVETLIDMTPVDYVSQAIVRLSSTPSCWNRAYHLVNPKPIEWRDLIQLLRARGHAFRELSLVEWKREMEQRAQDPKIISLLGMVPEEMLPTGKPVRTSQTVYDAREARRALASLQIQCPVADNRLVGLYLDELSTKKST